LPFSIIKGLYISEFEFVILLVAFLLLLVSVATRKRKMLIGMLSVLLLFMISLTVRIYSTDHQTGITFYSLRKYTAIDFIAGNQHILLADSTLMSDESTIDYSLKGAWAKRHLSLHPQVVNRDEDFESQSLRKRQNLVSFNGKLVALWDESRFSDSLSYRLPVDYLLVYGKQKPNIQSIVNGYDTKTLLIDGSVPNYLADQWMTQAEKQGMSYINIGDGAVEF